MYTYVSRIFELKFNAIEATTSVRKRLEIERRPKLESCNKDKIAYDEGVSVNMPAALGIVQS